MKVPAFFYGSYMDPEVLARFGARPGVAIQATLPGWHVTFTPHANIQQGDGEVRGFVFELPYEELDQLYGPYGYVTTYKPVPVMLETPRGPMAAMTFVEFAPEQAPDGSYLDSYLSICRRLNMHPDYVQALRTKAESLVRGKLV